MKMAGEATKHSVAIRFVIATSSDKAMATSSFNL
jgi:hypothetical protein